MSSTGNWITCFSLSNSGTWQWMESNQGQTNNPNPGYELSYLTPYAAQLIAGDFDGDTKTDILGNALPNGDIALLKRNPNNGKWNTFWNSNGSFSNVGLFRNNFVVGNFDSDLSDEIIGFSSSSCEKFDFANFTAASCVFGYGNPYSTISDWNINPSAYKYLLINTDANSKQQQLMTFRNTASAGGPTKFESNFYTFRPNIIGNDYPCSTLRLASGVKDNDINSKISTENIFVYPNPTEGTFDVILPTNYNIDNLKLSILDIQGREVIDYRSVLNLDKKSYSVALNNALSGMYFVKLTNNEGILLTSKLIVK